MHSVAFMHIAFHYALTAFSSRCILVHSYVFMHSYHIQTHSSSACIHTLMHSRHACIHMHTCACRLYRSIHMHSCVKQPTGAFGRITFWRIQTHSVAAKCERRMQFECNKMQSNANECIRARSVALRAGLSLRPRLLLRRRCCRARGRCPAGCVYPPQLCVGTHSFERACIQRHADVFSVRCEPIRMQHSL